MTARFSLVVSLVFGLGVAGCASCNETSPPVATPTATGPQATLPPEEARLATERARRVLIVFIDADQEVGPAPLRVDFAVYDPYQSLERPTYRWDFGDGSPVSHEKGPVHIFEKPGDYEVTLVVEEDGATDTDSVEIQVLAPETGE